MGHKNFSFSHVFGLMANPPHPQPQPPTPTPQPPTPTPQPPTPTPNQTLNSNKASLGNEWYHQLNKILLDGALLHWGTEASIKGRDNKLHQTVYMGCNYLSLPIIPRN